MRVGVFVAIATVAGALLTIKVAGDDLLWAEGQSPIPTVTAPPLDISALTLPDIDFTSWLVSTDATITTLRRWAGEMARETRQMIMASVSASQPAESEATEVKEQAHSDAALPDRVQVQEAIGQEAIDRESVDAARVRPIDLLTGTLPGQFSQKNDARFLGSGELQNEAVPDRVDEATARTDGVGTVRSMGAGATSPDGGAVSQTQELQSQRDRAYPTNMSEAGTPSPNGQDGAARTSGRDLQIVDIIAGQRQLDMNATATAPPQTEIIEVCEIDQTAIDLLDAERLDLERRSNQLAEREAVVAAAERRAAETIERLAALKSELEALMKARSEAERADLEKVVANISKMKPANAARALMLMNLEEVLDIFEALSTVRAAPILDRMPPEYAATVASELVKRRQPMSLPGN